VENEWANHQPTINKGWWLSLHSVQEWSDWAAITAENWSLLGCGAGLLVSDILMECMTFLLKGPGIVLGSHDPWEWRQYCSSKCLEPHTWQCSGASQKVVMLTPLQTVTTHHYSLRCMIIGHTDHRDARQGSWCFIFVTAHFYIYRNRGFVLIKGSYNIAVTFRQLHNDPYKRTDNIFAYNFRKPQLKCC